MQWAFIIPTILLALGCVAVLIFSTRESYRATLKEIEQTAENIRELVHSQIDIYERTYSLVFFFGNGLSADKTEFQIPESAGVQELFDISAKVDIELSLLCERISKSESFMSERGASVKKIFGEIEAHESSLLTSVSFLNERIYAAKRLSSPRISKYILKNLGQCLHSPIVFEKN